ncbi:MAG: CvpA family protein [Rhodospirillales bacterium]
METLKDLPVNVVDLAVLAVLLISAVFAYARGFMHEVLSIGGWIGAIFATIYGFPHVQPYARDLIPIQLAADLAAGVVVFVFTLFSLSFIIRAIAKHIQQSSLNVLDRSLGFLFGLVRGAIIVCLIYLGLEFLMTPEDQPKWLREAKSMPLVLRGSDALRALIPEDIEDKLKDAAPSGFSGPMPSIPKSEGEAIKRMFTPPPESQKAQPEDAYGSKERATMDRAIENATGR